jgi:hypothetical protein
MEEVRQPEADRQRDQQRGARAGRIPAAHLPDFGLEVRRFLAGE